MSSTTATLAEQEFETVLADIKASFKRMILERQAFVVKVGDALAKIRKGRESGICAELKSLLQDEVREHLISERLIEEYCRPEWKQKTAATLGSMGGKSRRYEETLMEESLVSNNGKSGTVTVTQLKKKLQAEKWRAEKLNKAALDAQRKALDFKQKLQLEKYQNAELQRRLKEGQTTLDQFVSLKKIAVSICKGCKCQTCIEARAR